MNCIELRGLSWEGELISKAANGDAKAFETLADRYRSALNSLAFRMLRNSDDANDVVQETLIKAFRGMPEFDPYRPIRPWLYRICTNCCVDAVRHRRRDISPLDLHENTLPDESESSHDRAAGSMRRRAILEAIGKLPDRYRDIILMRHFRHMDVNQIADALDKPEGTVKSWLFRARALLKKDLHMAIGHS